MNSLSATAGRMLVARPLFILLVVLAAFLPQATPPLALFTGIVFAFVFGTVYPKQVKKTQKYLLQASVVGLGFGMNVTEALKSGKIEKCTDYAIVDEHYYMNYTDFLANADHYDTYSRDETKKYYVFAGEYSANQQADLKGVTYSVIFNSVTAAIAEAAYMTGIERNGDIVKLAAYAPVFGHKVGANNQWAVDMIYYDNTSYLPSCNYYVQQMFSQNQGDYVLNAELTYEKKFEEMATYEIKRSGGAKGTAFMLFLKYAPSAS